MRAKNITGGDIRRIIDVFTPLVFGLEKREEKKSKGESSSKDNSHRNPYKTESKKKQGRLPPGWKEVVAPAGNTIYINTKTGVSELEAPKMTVSDMPFSDFVGRPSALSVFDQMSPDFYEPLGKAFESSAFKNLADIRAKSQEQVNDLISSGPSGFWG